MEVGSKEEKEKEEGSYLCWTPKLKLSGSYSKRKYDALYLFKAIAVMWHCFHYPFKMSS